MNFATLRSLAALSLVFFTSCVPGPYSDLGNLGGSDNSYNRYPDRYGYDRNYGYGYGRDWDRDDDHRHWDRDHHCHGRDCYDYERPKHPRNEPPKVWSPPAPPRPTKAAEDIARPSCPSGTTFDGSHCIVPKDQRRKGGKGTVNACPKGMWVSGDRCVGG